MKKYELVINQNVLDVDELKTILSYNQETGLLTWNYRPSHPKGWNTRHAGKVAGTVGKRGYIVINIAKKLYTGHRVAWAIVTGAWPDDQIDHINAIKTDNRWVNLRKATFNQNAQNRPICSANTSGFKGVYWHTLMRRWHAEIKKNGIKYHLGYYDTPESAHAAYVAKAIELFGEFARSA